jgi:protein-disulfide isomerase
MHLGMAAAAADMSQQEFEQRIRTYLLEHPEVLMEAVNRLDAKQGEQEAAAASAVLKDRAADVFQDPASPVSGNPKGEVTLVEFFDYNCPYCRVMVPLLTQAEAADPWLRIVYKEFPILGAGSVFAAKAALAANKRGKYVIFHRALYQLRGPLDEPKVLEVAANVGLDVQRMKADMQDAAIGGALEKNVKLAQALRITGTPGFVVGDQITAGATDFDGLQALIAKGRSGQSGAK